MANFKVGQRVRVIYQAPDSAMFWGLKAGLEAVIHAIPYGGEECGIVFDGDNRVWLSKFAYLSQLTDPRAQEFIEDMERFAVVTEGVPPRSRALK